VVQKQDVHHFVEKALVEELDLWAGNCTPAAAATNSSPQISSLVIDAAAQSKMLFLRY